MLLIRRLVWDSWNVAHIARHGVSFEEVEELCHGAFIDGEAAKGRIIIVGPTSSGRMLAAILDPEGEGAYYPVSARPASRKERRRYREETAGGEG